MTVTPSAARRSALRLVLAVLGAVVVGGVVLLGLAFAVLIVMLSAGGWSIG